MLPLWPPQSKAERLPREERLLGKLKKGSSDSHDWVRLEKAWSCTRCKATARSLRTLLTRKGERCSVRAAGVENLVEQLLSNGHKPMRVLISGQADLMVCSGCGKYVQSKKKEIMALCKKSPADGGRLALARLSKGDHPDRKIGGRVTAVFNEAGGGGQVSYQTLAPPVRAYPRPKAKGK